MVFSCQCLALDSLASNSGVMHAVHPSYFSPRSRSTSAKLDADNVELRLKCTLSASSLKKILATDLLLLQPRTCVATSYVLFSIAACPRKGSSRGGGQKQH